MRQAAEDGNVFSNIFLVTFAGQTSVKSHTIVLHLGDDNGTGTWTCAKDHGILCGHITNAQHELQRLVQVDPTATDDALREEVTEHIVPGVFYPQLQIYMLTNHQCESAVHNLQTMPFPISQCTHPHGPLYLKTL